MDIDVAATLQCHTCSYDLRQHLDAQRCPECGTAVQHSRRAAEEAARDYVSSRWQAALITAAWLVVLGPALSVTQELLSMWWWHGILIPMVAYLGFGLPHLALGILILPLRPRQLSDSSEHQWTHRVAGWTVIVTLLLPWVFSIDAIFSFNSPVAYHRDLLLYYPAVLLGVAGYWRLAFIAFRIEARWLRRACLLLAAGSLACGAEVAIARIAELPASHLTGACALRLDIWAIAVAVQDPWVMYSPYGTTTVSSSSWWQNYCNAFEPGAIGTLLMSPLAVAVTLWFALRITWHRLSTRPPHAGTS